MKDLCLHGRVLWGGQHSGPGFLNGSGGQDGLSTHVRGVFVNFNQTERGIVLLRIAVGLWLLHTVMSQIAWLPFPWASPEWSRTMVSALASAAQIHPLGWVRGVLETVLIPNTPVIAGLDVLLRLVAGISLVLGLLTVLGSGLGLISSLLYWLVFFPSGSAYLGLYGLITLSCLIFMLARAGRSWGLDALLSAISPRALLW